jgi:hypothetical protein
MGGEWGRKGRWGEEQGKVRGEEEEGRRGFDPLAKGKMSLYINA